MLASLCRFLCRRESTGMVAEAFTNFGTSALVTSSINSSATTFAITGGQGVLFPSANFIITMDTEMILIASRSTDTFTVATGGRGYDGSTAATHTSGAVVQLSICRYNLLHIWQNLSDTYGPSVPPVQAIPAGSPSAYDNEFEAAGSWTLTPSGSGGTTFAVNSILRSQLVLNRVSTDATLYTAYIAFAPGTAFTVTARISEASTAGSASGQEAQTDFFVSDQSTPTASSDGGNRMRIDLISMPNLSSSATSIRQVRMLYDNSGSPNSIGNRINISPGVPMYVRITYDGSGNWQGFFGDGYAYTLLGTKSGFSFTPASLGFSFKAFNTAVPQVVVVDFVRVVTGSVLPPYGS